MSQFENAIVEKNANIYFGGRVTSRPVKLSDGSEKTLGIMMPGEYEFGIDHPENFEVVTGDVLVKTEADHDWRLIASGESFDVPAKSKFIVKVHSIAEYCCSHLEA